VEARARKRGGEGEVENEEVEDGKMEAKMRRSGHPYR
jgi:hypothetical protein